VENTVVGASSLSTHTPWLDRYSTPDAQVLLEALPRGPKAAAQRVRTFFLDGLGAAEQVIWQGVWKWTLCYCTDFQANPQVDSGYSEKLKNGQQVAGHLAIESDHEVYENTNGAGGLAGSETSQISRLTRPQTSQAVEQRGIWMSRECGAFLIPDPKRLRLCVPITHSLALKWEGLACKAMKTAALSMDEILVAMANSIAKSPETEGKRWPVWELETVAQTKAILGFIFSSPGMHKTH